MVQRHDLLHNAGATAGPAMGWEERKGRRYYYEAERVGGRVVKRYLGAGRLAELACQLNALDADRRKWAKVDRELAAARRSRTPPLAKLAAVADAVLAVWLPACGWHRPNRGPWRRKRGCVVGELATLAGGRPLDTWDAEALRAAGGAVPPELAPKDSKPAPKAVAAYLAAHPAAVPYYGDLARRAVQRLASQLGGDGQVPAAAIVARADALRRALAGENPNPVELLVAERVVVCWAACHQYELLYYGSLDRSRTHKDHEFHERRIGAAHRRLLAALKALAAVRRLKLPDLLAVVKVVDAASATTATTR